ncbi:hypothetical protein [Psychrobacillus sp. L3]
MRTGIELVNELLERIENKLDCIDYQFNRQIAYATEQLLQYRLEQPTY